jgi:hypothetical protein
MLIGIKTAPVWFQRFIVETFLDFIDRNVLQIYLDDFILNTVAIKQHQEEADKLFDCMEKKIIKSSVNKSKMITMVVQFLGLTISENKIFPNNDRAKCKLQKPKPETLNLKNYKHGLVLEIIKEKKFRITLKSFNHLRM